VPLWSFLPQSEPIGRPDGSSSGHGIKKTCGLGSPKATDGFLPRPVVKDHGPEGKPAAEGFRAAGLSDGRIHLETTNLLAFSADY